MKHKPVALVTGANRSIGLQIVKDHRRRVYHPYRLRDLGRRETLAIEVGPTVVALQLDVTDKTSVAAAAR